MYCANQQARNGSSNALAPSSGSPRFAAAPAAPSASEAERFTAAKNVKEMLAKGIGMFNTKSPVKGVEYLISAGLLDHTPTAVSAKQQLQPLEC